jgi:hypothetical protein
VTDVYGFPNAHEFGPKKLKLVREHMIGLKWTRGTINKAISRIERMFKSAVQVVIGRFEQTDVQIVDPRVARVHLEFDCTLERVNDFPGGFSGKSMTHGP